MAVAANVVRLESVHQLLELGVVQHLAPHPGWVARVVAELHRVDRVNLEPQQLGTAKVLRLHSIKVYTCRGKVADLLPT